MGTSDVGSVGFISIGNTLKALLGCALLLTGSASFVASAEVIVGANTNAVGPTPANAPAGVDYYPDKLLRQQNEPSCAVQPENPLVVICGFSGCTAQLGSFCCRSSLSLK